MVKFKISEFLIFFVKSLYFINTTASEETEQTDFFFKWFTAKQYITLISSDTKFSDTKKIKKIL